MRSFHWLFIVWQVFWLTVFIPGHTRGAITLPDGKTACPTETPAEPSCCVPFGKPEKGKEPTQDQKNRCAVCYIVKGYTVPTIFVFDFSLSGTVVERLESLTPQITVLAFAFPFYPVGPPAA